MKRKRETGLGPIRPVLLRKYPALAGLCGVEDLTLALENEQLPGSFKIRAAWNLVCSVPADTVIAASSGNFSFALAYCCRIAGKKAIIVMPDDSAHSKVEAARNCGAEIILIDTSKVSRAERLAQLQGEYPDAYATNAYDDPHIIRGNATLGIELAQSGGNFQAVVAPVGGGGLLSGIIIGYQLAGVSLRREPSILGAEPAMADDAYRSLASNALCANGQEPKTVADGVRTLSLGRLNWPIIRNGCDGILTATEEAICEAVRILAREGVRAEPTGALALAAAMSAGPGFAGYDRVCIIVSGSNVDQERYERILAGETI